MTIYGDNIMTGNVAQTSALSSLAGCTYHRIHRFTQPSTGGAIAQTQTGYLPKGTINLDAKLYILANSSATVSDKITVSAAGRSYINMSQFGSAQGLLRQTVTGLGSLTVLASACAIVNDTSAADLQYSVTFTPVSASVGDYQVCLFFNRADTTFI